MTAEPALTSGAAPGIAVADGHFAQAICQIIAEGRAMGKIDPEMLALELEFALRGCYFQPELGDLETLKARAAVLLEAAGGTTKLEIVRGEPKPKPQIGDERGSRTQTFTFG